MRATDGARILSVDKLRDVLTLGVGSAPGTGPCALPPLCPEAVSGRADALRDEVVNKAELDAILHGVTLDAKRPACAVLGRASVRANCLYIGKDVILK